MAEKENALSKRDFSKVILTLENVLIPPDKLSPTPSFLDGLDAETEQDLRIVGCELIQTSGILLKLPQVAMATGQVLFQRFYYSKSFVKHDMEVVAMACVNLASKIEEAPRRIRDVINVVHHIKQVKSGKLITPLILDQNYINRKNQVIKAERRVLKELGFCCHVKHPHKIIVTYLHVLDADENRRLVQCAWNYMNDSFRSDVFVRYHPEAIACACIYLAARRLQIPLPNNPPWFYLFEVEESILQDISCTILGLYTRPKPNAEQLEKAVNEVKQVHIEAKLKAKGQASAGATPNSSSQAPSPAKISPSPLTVPGVRKIKEEDERSVGSNYSGRDRKSRSKHSRSRSPSRDRDRDRGRDRGHSRSKSRSPSKARSYSSRSRSRSRTPRSRSISRSPVYKRKYRSPKRTKKTNKLYSASKPNKRTHKRHRSPSYTRSISRSPDRPKKNKYKERHRSRSRSLDKYRSDKFLSRSRSRSRENHKAKKRNGHRRSHSRERYRR